MSDVTHSVGASDTTGGVSTTCDYFTNLLRRETGLENLVVTFDSTPLVLTRAPATTNSATKSSTPSTPESP